MQILLLHLYSSKPNPVYQQIAAGLRRRGHTVWEGAPNQKRQVEWRDGERLAATQPGPTPVPDRWRSVRPVSWMLKQIFYFAFVLRLRRFVRQVKPDILQVNVAMRFPWLLALLMPGDISCILDIRQINEGVDNRILKRIDEQRVILTMKVNARLIFDHTCFCHVQAAQRILGRNWSKWSTVVPVGIDPSFLTTSRVMPTPDKAESRVRFVYVGVIERFRELEKLMLAAERVRATTDDFEVVLIGPGQGRGYYQRLADDLHLNGVVTIEPPVDYDEIPELMAAYDVGLAYVPDRPTWHYQPAIKVLDYRAVGLAILSTDVTSHRETVEHGVNGLLVDNSVENLAQAMLCFVTDRGFLQRCQANAQVMRRGVTWDEVVTMYEQNVYYKLKQGDARDSESSLN